MGYRTYIGFLPKENYNIIKDLSKIDLYKYINETDIIEDEEIWVGVYKLGVNLYEFGKCTEFDNKKYYQPFFTNKETQSFYNEDEEIWVVCKEYLEVIINHYKEKIKKFYNDDYLIIKEFIEKFKTEDAKQGLINGFDLSKIVPLLDSINSKRIEWTSLTPYNLEEGDSITTSWKYEYSIFELVNIYKNFDWDNNVMYYYGY